MTGALTGFIKTMLDYYTSLMGIFPEGIKLFINFLFLVILVVIYSIFVWNFYKFISKKNPLGLNLNQYNNFQHSFISKLVTGIFYFVEYILILPFLIFFIFAIFTFFLISLSQTNEVPQILIISATVIAAIRITSYYKESLSQEIAKMLPFMLLAVSVLNPDSFIKAQYIEKVINSLSQIPLFLNEIKSYLIFIIIIEIILVFFNFIFSLFKTKPDIEEIGENEKDKN